MAFATPAAFAAGENQIGLDLAGDKGGLAIGADYIRAAQKNFGYGGYIHYFEKNTSRVNANGLFAFGGEVNVHYEIEQFDVYVAPGFGFVDIDPVAANSSTAFTAGPRLAVGALYKINSQWSAGIENVRYYSWFNAGFNGEMIDDLAVRGRFTF
jgi:hypothetical protein